jgi:hypothetical protein
LQHLSKCDCVLLRLFFSFLHLMSTYDFAL